MNVADLAPEQPEKRLHIERYEYAARSLAGLRVLDCACGMGYGTEILRAGGCIAVGVDIDPEAIGLARQRYPLAEFQTESIHDIPFDGYDALVSFETLEHLTDPAGVIARLPEMVKQIIASVPIRPTVGWNPWHHADFTADSFARLIETKFRIIHRYGQLWVDKEDLYLMLHGVRA